MTQTMERPGGDRAVGDGGARPELRALTGLRGVAAFWVLFYHLIPMASENIPSLRWLQRVTVTGDLGVDLFFLLSGFVLSYAYTTDKLFGPGGGPVERLRYYLHFLSIRLARIYPVNLAVLLVLALVVFASHVAHVELHQTGTFSWDFVRNLLLVQGWDLSSHLSWDGPAWSVSCEWAAYLAFPFIFLMVSRVRRTRSAVLGMVASLAAMLIFYGFFGAGQPQLTYHYPLVRIAGEFIAGCFLYRVYASRSGRPSRWTRLRSVVGPCSLGAALIVAAILNAVGLAAVWVVPLFVLVLVGTWRDDTPWGRLLSSPRMVHAGEASYALYMIHYPALLILQKVWSVPSSTGLRLIIIVVGTTGIWVSALLVYRYFEVPARRHLRVASQVLLPASARQPLDQQSPMGAPRRRGQGAIGATARLRRDSLLVLAGNVVTGLSNYGLTLALIWILPARQFSQVASLAALLLVAGTAAQASIPWVVARELVHRPFGDPARRQAVGFALVVALVFGAATAAIVFALSSGYAGSGVELAAVVAIPAIFVTQVGNGYLQGSHRFRFYAVLVVLEGVVRLGFGAALAAAGAGPAGAVGGYAVGAVITAGIALWIVRRDLAWPRRVSVGLWQQLGGIGGIQVGVALLAMLDVICESVVQGTSRAFAGYQAMLVFTRIPLFLSAAISAVAYPRLSKQGSDDTTIVDETTSLFLLTAAFCVAVVSSLPTSLLSLVFPRGYAHSAGLLLPLAIAGFACGQVNLSTTLLQAKSAFRTAFRVLAVGLPVATVLLVLASSSVLRLAWVAAAADGTAAVVLVVVTDRFFAGRVIAKPTLVGVLATAPLVAVLRVLRPDPVAWLLGVVVLSVVFVALVRRGLRDDPLPLTAPRRLPVDTRVHPAVVVPVKPVVMNGAARPPLRPHSHPVEVLES